MMYAVIRVLAVSYLHSFVTKISWPEREKVWSCDTPVGPIGTTICTKYDIGYAPPPPSTRIRPSEKCRRNRHFWYIFQPCSCKMRHWTLPELRKKVSTSTILPYFKSSTVCQYICMSEYSICIFRYFFKVSSPTRIYIHTGHFYANFYYLLENLFIMERYYCTFEK